MLSSWRRQWHPTPVTLAWIIPWTEEPGRVHSMGLLRIGHDWVTSLSLFTCNPLQYSCLENPRDGGAWWAAISGVAQSRTRLKRLSSRMLSSISAAAFYILRLYIYIYIYIYIYMTSDVCEEVAHCGCSICSSVLICIGEGNGDPLQYYCLENPMDGGAW